MESKTPSNIIKIDEGLVQSQLKEVVKKYCRRYFECHA